MCISSKQQNFIDEIFCKYERFLTRVIQQQLGLFSSSSSPHLFPSEQKDQKYAAKMAGKKYFIHEEMLSS